MADDLPIAEIVHAMRGRARLRIAARLGDTPFFAALATGLATIPGVYKVDVRPFTGSVVVDHGPPLARIGEAARAAHLFALGGPVAPPPPPLQLPVDPKIIVGIGLGLFALWQLTQGRILPPAVTLGWYAAALTGLLRSADGETGVDGE